MEGEIGREAVRREVLQNDVVTKQQAVRCSSDTTADWLFQTAYNSASEHRNKIFVNSELINHMLTAYNS
jgi:hypothetical protein